METRLYEADASESVPSLSTLTSEGFPTEGDPELAVPATKIGAAWFYALGEEIRNAILKAGLTPTNEGDGALSQLAESVPVIAIDAYNSNKPYIVGRVIGHNGKLWLCKQSNNKQNPVEPGTNKNVWQQIQTESDVVIVPDATISVKGKVQLCDNIADEPTNQTKAVTPHAVAVYVSSGGRKANDIGIVGRQGFGVGFPDATEDELAAIGMSPMNGTYDKTSDNYGNFMSDNGGQFVYIPHHYIRYGDQSDPDYDVYGANVLSVKTHDAYNSEAEANADGYFSLRAFYDGSESVNQPGFFMQKYEPNGKTLDGVVYAYGDGTARGMVNIDAPTMMTRARNLGSDYFVASWFMHQAMDAITLLQGQHSTGTANCAWWKSRGGANYPNNGWSTTNPQLYSHNGQKCGVMAVSNFSWEFCLGVTTPGSSATQGQTAIGNNKIFLLKPTVKMKDLTNGFGGKFKAAWGNATHLATIYDEFDTTDHFSLTSSRTWYWGNGNNQMYISPVKNGELNTKARDSFMLIPNSEQSVSASANTMMGACLSYTNPCTQNLALYVHGENVYTGGGQNVFSRLFITWRVLSYDYRSFRCGAYLRDH
ncbi:MAG: hypothetical protein SPK83_06485 [Succinivibrio dextrinosolvens]|nr:hypothetical protein [Succinivibrio dextrinosolvens]